ncbi:MAG TPA: hypothetical protein VMX17_13470 [Candidatus Glassbacteria bacterium]|nr:hypothetical protein [Candidatus Glassbacteria bacterium]
MMLLTFGRIAPKLEIGQRWILDDDIKMNPFDESSPRIYTVLDIKDGFVKYQIHSYSDSDTINGFRFSRTLMKEMVK